MRVPVTLGSYSFEPSKAKVRFWVRYRAHRICARLRRYLAKSTVKVVIER